MVSPCISVVVPTYRRPHLLPPLIDALGAQDLDAGDFEAIIIDNGSDDDTGTVLARLAEKAPFVLPLRVEPNRGPAAARNVGWRAARAPIVAFLDDDCEPSPGWLRAGLKTMERDPGLGIVQGRTDPPSGVDVRQLRGWYLWREVTGPTAFFEGCNLFLRREALEQTGGFDEDIGFWGEDSSLGWAVREAGWRHGFSDEARVVHPVEHRGWCWFLRNGFVESKVVAVAAKHPGYRHHAFWRPWAFRREDPALVVAVLAMGVALRWRPAALAALPYLWLRRPSVRHLDFVRLGPETVAVDVCRCLGHLEGALRHRMVVV